MVYLNNIVSFLNDVLKVRLSMYPTAEYSGIATYATKNLKDGKIIVYPTEIPWGANGAETLSLSFKSPFNIYHRLSGTTFSREPGSGYGDDLYTTVSTTEVQLIVWGVRNKISTTPEQFSMILSDALPDKIAAAELSGLGINNIYIDSVSINYDQRAVFSQEMQGVKYFIGPELFLFSFRYRIIGSYTKGCLNICDC